MSTNYDLIRHRKFDDSFVPCRKLTAFPTWRFKSLRVLVLLRWVFISCYLLCHVFKISLHFPWAPSLICGVIKLEIMIKQTIMICYDKCDGMGAFPFLLVLNDTFHAIIRFCMRPLAQKWLLSLYPGFSYIFFYQPMVY